jgi:anaerobic magnesium-protoporphyrin IX monomethyl ester cyclase
MRVALVRCFDSDQGQLSAADPPLGLLTLAAAVRQRAPGWEPLLFDQALATDFATFAASITAAAPEVVGFSVLESTMDAMVRLSHWLRAALPDTLQIVGGPGADRHARALASAPLDQVFLGEADHRLPRWLEVLAAGGAVAEVAGVVSRGAQAPVGPAPPVEDLDALPDPAWDLVDPGAYRSLPFMNVFTVHPRAMPVMTSRGCPHGCIYCHGRFGQRVRAQSAARVLDSWERLERDHGVGELHVYDDAFAFDHERARAILRGKIQRGLRARIAFCNGLRGDLLSDELIDLMERAGCWAVSFGIESASPRVQRLVGKRLDLDKTARSIRRCAERGMLTRGFFMVGFPGETVEEASASFRLAVDLPLDWAHFFSVVPFPGTELARQHLPEGDEPRIPAGAYESGEPFFGDQRLRGMARRFHQDFRRRPVHMARLALRTRAWPGFWRVNAGNAVEVGLLSLRRRLAAGLPGGEVGVRITLDVPAARLLEVLLSTEGYRRWVQNPWVEVELQEPFREGCVTHRYRKQGLRRGQLLVAAIAERVDPSRGFVDRFVDGDFRGTHAVSVRAVDAGRCVAESVISPRFRSPVRLLEWKLGGGRSHSKVVRRWLEAAGALAAEGQIK